MQPMSLSSGRYRPTDPALPAVAVSAIACDHCAVRHRALCGALSHDEIAQLNQISRQRTLAAGQTILSDHERPDYFANVVHGVVKLSKTLPDGRQQIVGLQFPSDFLGRPFGDHSPFFAEAATDVSLCCYPKAQFEQLMQRFPGIEHRLFEHTLDELDSAREWMLLLGRKTAAEKVASFLLMIARRASQVGCTSQPNTPDARFELPLTRADMGDYLGLTIETVSRQITKLKTDGIIRLETGRWISVAKLSRLEQAAETER
jgi:CRP/FNR family transcriptional regulator